MAHRDEACFAFAKDMLRAFDDFHAKVSKLIDGHLKSHDSKETEDGIQATHVGIGTTGKTLGEDSFLCPTCAISFDRRSNLGRHWRQHVNLQDNCCLCDHPAPTVHDGIMHFEKCLKKADPNLSAEEMANAESQQNEWKNMADQTLNDILVQHGKGRKRKPKQPKGSASKRLYAGQTMTSDTVAASPRLCVSTANDTSGTSGQTPSSPTPGPSYAVNQYLGPQGLLQLSTPALSNIHPLANETIRTDDSEQQVSTDLRQLNIPEDSAFASSYTIDMFPYNNFGYGTAHDYSNLSVNTKPAAAFPVNNAFRG